MNEHGWDVVDAATENALSISWDGCHKIYLAMDQEQYAWFQQNYENTIRDTPEFMREKLRYWFDESCPLRFIQSVSSPADNDDFTNLIPQCWDEDDDGVEW